MRKQQKMIRVQNPTPQYRTLATLLTEQRQSKTVLGGIYGELAGILSARRFDDEAFCVAVDALVMEIGYRTGRAEEASLHLHDQVFNVELETAWLTDFLVECEDRARYNVTLTEACKVVGEALTAHYSLPPIQWRQRYAYAAPPNLARRLPVPA